MAKKNKSGDAQKTSKNKKQTQVKNKFNYGDFYKSNYKKLLIIPFILFFIAGFTILTTYKQESSPFYKDVSLKGGLSAIVKVDLKIDSQNLKILLEENFQGNSFSISEISDDGQNKGFIIDTDLEEEKLIEFLETYFEVNLIEGESYDSNFISSSLASSFFRQAFTAFIFSFVFMSIVVFIYFREFVPSGAVVLSAVFDIVVTIGVLNLINFKVSVAGIGALLMLVGYSIDTDILLTNRLVKERGDNYFEKTFYAFKTGTLMSLTTLIAGIAALILTNSEIIFEIALILVIGLLVDYISTWIQNSALLLWWLERK